MTRLLAGDASQKELGADLNLASGTVSRRMKELESLGIVQRDRSHGPYQIVLHRQVWQLLQAAADLARDVAAERATSADTHATQLRRRGMRVTKGAREEGG